MQHLNLVFFLEAKETLTKEDKISSKLKNLQNKQDKIICITMQNSVKLL